MPWTIDQIEDATRRLTVAERARLAKFLMTLNDDDERESEDVLREAVEEFARRGPVRAEIAGKSGDLFEGLVRRGEKLVRVHPDGREEELAIPPIRDMTDEEIEEAARSDPDNPPRHPMTRDPTAS